ncbi:hypothetical protein H6P81_010064 [Aristolochia fimbriata]|uniref:Uncharacterized protein n=1 Tax=Aristolochia fimbriata TaxID=158543 RepID=A0AAV7ENY4_ARIFI|nr:hypothetical protein H6P81_010064 [Aristolochia fimbriata]
MDARRPSRAVSDPKVWQVGFVTPTDPPEQENGAITERQNECAAVSKPLKERTSKVEKHALQEAQRAQKAAARDMGESSIGASAIGSKQKKAAKPPPPKKDGASGWTTVPCGGISGGNSRCIAVLHAFRDAIKDCSTPPEKDLFLDLTAIISSYDLFLKKCPPLSIGTENAIKFLKNRFT